MAVLIICNWHTECSCGYGRGGYMSQVGKDPETHPPLSPDSTTCPGCGEEFTETDRWNTS